MLAVRDANRRLKLQLPEDGGYTTIAGFLMAQAGRLLQQGDVVEFEDSRFEVERLERRRIRRIRLRRINQTSSQDESLSESATVNQ